MGMQGLERRGEGGSLRGEGSCGGGGAPRDSAGSGVGSLESDTTKQLHFHFSLSCIGEGNGNPLQYSCLENSMDRGAWWATVHWVMHT